MNADRHLTQRTEHPDGIAVRVADEADLPAIVALLADDPLGKSRERSETPLPQSYRDAFAAMARQSGNVYLLADRDGQTLGCLQMTIIHGISREGMTRVQIEGVRVAAETRGLGVGNVLMADAIERAKALGCGLVQLTTDTRRQDARRFYEKLGFVASHTGMKLDLMD